MQTQNTTTGGLDFTGQNIYVGLDTHYKSWVITIYSDEFELKTFGQEPDVDRLENYLHKHYPNANLKLAYESGFCGFWIQRAFAKRGFHCDVVHSRLCGVNYFATIIPSSSAKSYLITPFTQTFNSYCNSS